MGFSKGFHIFVRGVSWFPARTVPEAPPSPLQCISQYHALAPPDNSGALLDQHFCLEGGAGI